MSRAWLYGLLTSVMIVWGLNVIAVKWIVDAFAPVTITSIRIFIASMSLWPLLVWGKLIQRPGGREVRYLSVIALSGVLAHHLCLAIGLANTSSANGGLILGTVPIVTSILATVMLGVRLSLFRMIGLLSGFFWYFVDYAHPAKRQLAIGFGRCIRVFSRVGASRQFHLHS